ncbi:DUF2178 domain-containing protein [Archaeoglobus neptunius]|uniref:DUF2178 domain-containing protein n=1 Tax=Archaeoglobus neptunius TaxID=2798580 RepID=UPI00192825C5|nr:DUF2178 domain-containing protein [Archaeoglobus neptunius]
MNRKLFVVYSGLIVAAMGMAVGYGVSAGNALLPLAAFAVGSILIALGRRRVTDIIEDERDHRISEKASKSAWTVFTIGAALLGTTLIALNEQAQTGYTLAYSACVLLVLYFIFYGYYSRKAVG